MRGGDELIARNSIFFFCFFNVFLGIFRRPFFFEFRFFLVRGDGGGEEVAAILFSFFFFSSSPKKQRFDFVVVIIFISDLNS